MPWFEALKKRITPDRTVAFVLIVICAFLYWEADHYLAGGSYFPHFSLAAVILLSFLMLIFSFLPRQRHDRKKIEGAEKIKRNLRPFFLLCVFFIYLFVLPFLGLYSSTVALICAVMALLKVRQFKLYALAVLVIGVIFYIFFGLVLKVSIPGSILI